MQNGSVFYLLFWVRMVTRLRTILFYARGRVGFKLHVAPKGAFVFSGNVWAGGRKRRYAKNMHIYALYDTGARHVNQFETTALNHVAA